MRGFSLRQFRRRSGRAPGGRNPRQATAAAERRDDVPILAPTTAAARLGIAQDYCSAALYRNLLQFPCHEKRNPLPVRREERKERPIGSRQFRGLGLVEPPGEEAILRYMHQARAVG